MKPPRVFWNDAAEGDVKFEAQARDRQHANQMADHLMRLAGVTHVSIEVTWPVPDLPADYRRSDQ